GRATRREPRLVRRRQELGQPDRVRARDGRDAAAGLAAPGGDRCGARVDRLRDARMIAVVLLACTPGVADRRSILELGSSDTGDSRPSQTSTDDSAEPIDTGTPPPVYDHLP